MALTGDYLVSITLKGINMASGVFKDVAGEAANTENVIQRNAATFQKTGIAMTVAGGAIVGGMVAAATKAAEFGGSLVDMSARTGTSIESLSALGYAAKQTGADMSTVETGLKFVSKNAVAAAEGTGPAADAFKQLGISVTDASGNMKSAEALFMEAGNGLRNVDDEATRTALSMAIFGRSGTQLIPMFTDGSKSLSDFTAEAQRLGLVVSTDTANKMDDFGDRLDQLKAQSGAMWANLGAAAIPVLTNLLNIVQPVVTWITKWIENNPTLAQGVAMGAFAVGSFLSVVGPLVLMLPTLDAGLKLIGVTMGVQGIAGATTSATTAIAGMAPGMAALAASAAPIIAVGLAVAGLVYELYRLKQAYDETAAAGEQLIKTQQREYALRAEYGRRTGTEAEMAAQQREIDNATPTLGERFTGWVTGGGVTGQTLAQTRVSAGQSIPMGRRASGGPIFSGMPYLVGERGPEIVVPGTNGTVIPNNAMGGQQIVVNINGPIYGDDGIREIAQEEIGKAARAGAYEGRAISYA